MILRHGRLPWAGVGGVTWDQGDELNELGVSLNRFLQQRQRERAILELRQLSIGVFLLVKPV